MSCKLHNLYYTKLQSTDRPQAIYATKQILKNSGGNNSKTTHETRHCERSEAISCIFELDCFVPRNDDVAVFKCVVL